MKQIRTAVCILMATLIPGLSVVGNDLPADKVERVRTGMTICGAVLGLGIGIPSVLDLIPKDTPLSQTLLVAIPVVATTMITGALASRWVADTTLELQPALLLSPIVGAGLGMIGSAVAGGISFALAFAIAVPVVEVSTGDFDYLQSIGMGFLAGAVWGGIAGIPAGAVAVPIISLYMGF
jgi:hypothetical protein